VRWCSAAGGHGGTDGAVVHVERMVRRVEARLGGDGGGGGAHHRYAEPGSARPNAAPVTSNRHCSPVLHGSCPPVCLRYMGSARANRSGWSPDSEWKEFVEMGPRGATSGIDAVCSCG